MQRCFSHVRLVATLWTVACWAPLFRGFSMQEYHSGLPCSSAGDLPDPGIKPASPTPPALASRFFTTSATGKTPVGSILEANKPSFLCSNRNFTNSEIRLYGEQRARIPSALTPSACSGEARRFNPERTKGTGTVLSFAHACAHTISSMTASTLSPEVGSLPAPWIASPHGRVC